MPKQADLIGKYEISVGDKEIEKHICGAQLRTNLDAPNVMLVSVAQNAESIGKLAGGKLPKEAEFKWQGKGLFKGSLMGAQLDGHSRMTLTYGDTLHLAQKTSVNGFVKKQSLKDCLEKLAKEADLKTRFQGSFSEKLPGFTVGGKSVFEHFQELSRKYGFFFTYRAFSNTLYFVQLGKEIKAEKLDCEKELGDISISQAGNEAYSDLKIKYFDAKSMETKEKKVGQSELYKPVMSYAEHPTYRQKMDWKHAKGKLETHVTDLYHFESADKLLKNEFSKKLMGQERVSLKCYKPVALPGDKITLDKCPSPAIEDGDYFVESVNVYLQSAIPFAEIHAIRP